MKLALEDVKSKLKSGHAFSQEEVHLLLDSSRDIISVWLDKLVPLLFSMTPSKKKKKESKPFSPLLFNVPRQHGATITDHKIFSALSSFWEASFSSDMDKLGVLRPDVITRVSEFVPACVAYTQKIIDNGYA